MVSLNAVPTSLVERICARPEVVAELQTNQWNALLVGEDARILAVAWTRSAGGRQLRTGYPYEPPAPSARFGADAVSEGAAWARWRAVMEDAPAGERRSLLLREFAYTGAPNAEFILGGDEGAVRSAFERWWWLRSLPPAEPALLHAGRRTLPYPLALPGLRAEPVRSLLEGMDVVDKIANTPVRGDRPVTLPKIKTVTIEEK